MVDVKKEQKEKEKTHLSMNECRMYMQPFWDFCGGYKGAHCNAEE